MVRILVVTIYLLYSCNSLAEAATGHIQLFLGQRAPADEQSILEIQSISKGSKQDITYKESFESQMAKKCKGESCPMRGFYSFATGWGTDENATIYFAAITQKGDWTEVSNGEKGTLWIKSGQANNTSKAKAALRIKEFLTGINVPAKNVYSQPSESSKKLDPCMHRESQSWDVQGDWIQVECRKKNCLNRNEREPDPMQEDRTDAELEAARKATPCPLGWVRWRGKSGMVVLRIDNITSE